MTSNKQTVAEYLSAFRVTDHARILACLTDDVEWVIPGMVHRRGKAEFDAEIENDAFIGRPLIIETRMTEENDVVAVEGTVQATKRDGGILNLMFCDVFEMRGGKIGKLTSYLMPVGG